MRLALSNVIKIGLRTRGESFHSFHEGVQRVFLGKNGNDKETDGVCAKKAVLSTGQAGR